MGNQANASNGVDWAAAAQQWLKSREFFEQWQKQQWQMMAASMAAATPGGTEQPLPAPSTDTQSKQILFLCICEWHKLTASGLKQRATTTLGASGQCGHNRPQTAATKDPYR